MGNLWTVQVLTLREQVSSLLTRRLVNVLAIVVMLWLIALSTGVFGFAGLGGYNDEKAVGNGVGEVLFIGSGANGPIVIGHESNASPATPTTTEPGLSLLQNVLLVLLALVIVVTVLMFSGNPTAAMIAATIGVIGFIIVQQMLLSI